MVRVWEDLCASVRLLLGGARPGWGEMRLRWWRESWGQADQPSAREVDMGNFHKHDYITEYF